MKSLEELKKERDKLEQKIFIAETLAVTFGMDIIKSDDDLSAAEAAAITEVLKECIRESAEIAEDK